MILVMLWICYVNLHLTIGQTEHTRLIRYAVLSDTRIDDSVSPLTSGYHVPSITKRVVDCANSLECLTANLHTVDDDLVCTLLNSLDVLSNLVPDNSASFIFVDNDVYHYFGGKIYWRDPQRLNWTEAQAACHASQGHLAEVHSAEQDAFVYSLGRESSSWLGGSDAADEGIWLWEPSGEPFTYTNWLPGQPNNLDDNQHCVYQNGADGTWYDEPCDSFRYPICEYP